MSTPGPPGGFNPFEKLFADLGRMFAQQGPVNWDVARQIGGGDRAVQQAVAFGGRAVHVVAQKDELVRPRRIHDHVVRVHAVGRQAREDYRDPRSEAAFLIAEALKGQG